MVPLYQSVISGLLIGLKAEMTGSVGVCFYNFSNPQMPKDRSAVLQESVTVFSVKLLNRSRTSIFSECTVFHNLGAVHKSTSQDSSAISIFMSVLIFRGLPSL